MDTRHHSSSEHSNSDDEAMDSEEDEDEDEEEPENDETNKPLRGRKRTDDKKYFKDSEVKIEDWE